MYYVKLMSLRYAALKFQKKTILALCSGVLSTLLAEMWNISLKNVLCETYESQTCSSKVSKNDYFSSFQPGVEHIVSRNAMHFTEMLYVQHVNVCHTV